MDNTNSEDQFEEQETVALPPSEGNERSNFQKDGEQSLEQPPASRVSAQETPTARPFNTNESWEEEQSPREIRSSTLQEEQLDCRRQSSRANSSIFVGLVAGVLGASLTVAALAIGGVFDQTGEIVQTPQIGTSTPFSSNQSITEGATSSRAAVVAQKVVPSIVAIEVSADDGINGFSAFAAGSGVVLTDDGLIVTNAHVIANATDTTATQVVLQNGTLYDARIIGKDTITDLAVLQIEATDLTPIELGSTIDLAIGDVAVAVGNPLGLPGGASVTVGVVSAFDREVQVGAIDGTLFGMLQTDAPITRGSSGGGLVDENGRLIGITTAIGVTDAGAEGIGFAIPVELMTRITEEIIETGRVRHTFLGVALQDTYAQQGAAQIPSGAEIVGFVAPSGAREAGLEENDRAIGINNKPVRTKEDIINELRNFRVGDTVVLEVIRDGETMKFDVRLGEKP